MHDIYTYIHSNISNNIVGSVHACMCACVRACVYCCKHNQEALPVTGAWPRDVSTRSHFLESPKKLTSREPHMQCGLCQGHHAQMSEPRTWKSEQAQLTARTLNIETSLIVCHPCRDDITRLAKNPNHHPRWISKLSVCSMQDCKMTSKTKCSLEQLISIADTVRCHIPPSVTILTPFCKVYYHLVYNALQPQQTHCPTCGSKFSGIGKATLFYQHAEFITSGRGNTPGSRP